MIPAAGAGVLTVIVPVATVQVGCVGVAVGAAGADGAAINRYTGSRGDTTCCILHSHIICSRCYRLVNTPVVFV